MHRALSRPRPLILLIVLLLASVTTAAWAAPGVESWPRWSGPNHDLSAQAGLAADAGVELGVAWTVPLGSAYSGIVTAGDLVVTGFADGESDYLGAFDAASGAETWRYRLGKTYVGHDGSDDGPIATPTIHGDLVYGLGAWGELAAVDVATGAERWRKTLDGDFGGRKPEYGFSSTPTVIDGTLVVQAGGTEGRSIVGLDPATGERRWATGDDRVGYQSPIGLTVDGTSFVLAVTNQHLFGLDPANGNELWSWEHGGEDDQDGSMQPVPAGKGRVLLTSFQGVQTVRIAQAGGEWSVEKLWEGGIRSTWAFPVPHGDHVYGFAGQFLTCLDAETGEAVWKSRPPGRGTLIAVDDHLVILAATGEMVVAEASPEGYREKTRTAVLDEGYLTSPSFASGRVYVRNLSQMAAVTIGRGEQAVAQAAAPAIPDDAFVGQLGEQLKGIVALEAGARERAAADLVAEQESFPVIEGDRLVHFLYHGETEDLALTSNHAANVQLPMHRIPNTDLYFHSVELEPASSYLYNFAVFEDNQLDPRNDRQFGGEDAPLSVVTTGGWETPAHLDGPGERRGTIETMTWQSEILDNEREVRVYLPHRHGINAGPYPLLVINYGGLALDQGQVDQSLDRLIGDDQVEPMIVAFVPRLGWDELAGSTVADYGRALAEELLPKLDAAYDLEDDPARRAIAGPVAGAFGALHPSLAQTGSFGKVGVFSFYYGDLADDLDGFLEAREPGDLEVFAVWSRQDYQFRQYDTRAQGPKLLAQLREAGVTAGSLELGDGYGWMMWRRGLAAMLQHYFPGGCDC